MWTGPISPKQTFEIFKTNLLNDTTMLIRLSQGKHHLLLTLNFQVFQTYLFGQLHILINDDSDDMYTVKINFK